MVKAVAQTVEQEASGFSLTAAFGRLWDAIKSPFQKGDLTNNFTAAHDDTLPKPDQKIEARFKPSVEERDQTPIAGVLIPDSDDVQTFPVPDSPSIVATNLLDTEEYGAIEPSNQFDPQALAMQTKLKALGYDLEQGHEFANDGVDGYYGKVTIAAVEQFQRDNGLEVSGIANGETLALMQEKFEALPPVAPAVHANANDGGFIKASFSRAHDSTFTNAQQNILDGMVAPLDKLLITSNFSPARVHPTLKNADGSSVVRPHNGIDLRTIDQNTGEHNQSVYASYDGEVVYAGHMGGYGNIIKIDHGEGVISHYAHLDKMDVKVGDHVSRGMEIAKSGDTGLGVAHLDYGIKVSNNFINAEIVLQNNLERDIPHKYASKNNPYISHQEDKALIAGTPMSTPSPVG